MIKGLRVGFIVLFIYGIIWMTLVGLHKIYQLDPEEQVFLLI